MAWMEKGQPTPLDDQPIDGLWFLDGDQVARIIGREWTKGQKYPLMVFPSEVECDLWISDDPQRIGTIHLFGEMDLPLGDTRDSAFEQAFDIAEQCGYMVRKVGADSIELWGHEHDDHLIVVYDPDVGRMVDVVRIKDEGSMPPARDVSLLDDEMREALPPLYANEEKGLEAQALLKLFTPDSNWTWYASEFDGKDVFFGLVVGFEIELGYFSLSELEAVRGPLGLPIERDRDFEPASLKALREQHRRERGER